MPGEPKTYSVYWCPICEVQTGGSWHSLRDGGLFPQNDTEHNCVTITVVDVREMSDRETILRWIEAGFPPWGCHNCRGAEYGPDGVPCPACGGRSDEVVPPDRAKAIEAKMAGHDRRRFKFDPDWRVPPGEILREVMDERGFRFVDLACAVGSHATARALLVGELDLTPAVAVSLEKFTGVSYQFWMGLEAQYRKPLSEGVDDGSAEPV